MPKIFILNKLRKDADPKEYEKWVKEVDYPSTSKWKSVKYYRNHKVTRQLKGVLECDYIEYGEITNLQDYKKDLSAPWYPELYKQWKKYVKEAKIIFAEVIEP